MKRVRIDRLLVERGLVSSRERARAMIMAGDVLVDDVPIAKAGANVPPEAMIRLRRPEHRWASRGGVKLEGALETFAVVPEGQVAADIGASTGGFTDCLLAHGALRVYAVDVDPTQLAWKLQTDPRVLPVRGNARYFESGWLPEMVDLITIDVSFISLGKILPAVVPALRPEGRILALVKPQFEVGREKVGKGGIVSDPDTQTEAVEAVIGQAVEGGLSHRGTCRSPITGKEGNQEFFVLLARESKPGAEA
jgi:23S rRNA (cytidine1920-2'-O)/16S rRNA (cytidine1409-2'-O)-methyltransferase